LYDDRPHYYQMHGPQPGDLVPNLDIVDNLKHYHLNIDLEFTVKANSLGFRGPEPPSDPTPAILVLGDSFAFGMGVSEGETFTDGLRTELRAELPKLAVYNAATSGYTVTDHIEQWRDRVHSVRPDLVLLCHTASDLKEMARPVSFRRLLAHDEDDPKHFDADVQRLIDDTDGDKGAAVRRHWMFSEDELRSKLGGKSGLTLRGLQRAYTDGVLELAAEVSKSGARLAVILWVGGYGMDGLDTGPLREALDDKKVAYFEASKALSEQGEIPQNKLSLPDDHLSPEGNALTARQIAAWIKAQGLLLPAKP